MQERLHHCTFSINDISRGLHQLKNWLNCEYEVAYYMEINLACKTKQLLPAPKDKPAKDKVAKAKSTSEGNRDIVCFIMQSIF